MTQLIDKCPTILFQFLKCPDLLLLSAFYQLLIGQCEYFILGFEKFEKL